MQIFFWKKNKQIDAFANTIANDLYSTIPPEIAQDYMNGPDSKTKKVNIKVARKLDDIVLRIKQFRAENRIGVYGKARLHLKFMARLEELGYEKKVAKLFNEQTMIRTP